MALLQPTKAIFYHPLDTATETIKSEAWTGTSSFVAAKVSSGLVGVESSSPSYGTESEFQPSAATGGTEVAALGSTKVVVAYGDLQGGSNGRAKVGTISGTDITWGAAATFKSGTTPAKRVAALDSTSLVIFYNDSGTPTTKIGTVSGTDITFGSGFAPGGIMTTNFPDVAAFDSMHFLIASKSTSSGRGVSRIGLVSGTDITFGAESQFEPDTFLGEGAEGSKMAAMSATVMVICYEDRVSGGIGTSKVGTRSGVDMTWGAKHTYESSSGHLRPTGVTPFDSSKFVVAYAFSGGKTKVGTVSGTDITFGSVSAYTTAITAPLQSGLVTLTSTKVIVVWNKNSGGDIGGRAQLGTVSGTDVTWGSETLFQSGGTNGAEEVTSAGLDTSRFVVTYHDDADSDHGTGKVGFLGNDASLSGLTADYDSVAAATKVAFAGWFKKPSM